MSRPTTIIEWYTAQNDADWERLCAPSRPAPLGRLSSRHFLCSVALLLGLLVSAGGWWWRTERVALSPAEVDVPATAQHELEAVVRHDDPASLSWDYQFARQEHGLHAAIQTADPAAHLDLVIDTLELQSDQAVARVVYNEHGAAAYRQTRFYQHTVNGWQQTAPNANLWGPARSLETPSFVFQFRQNDAPAVIAVAPQLDALYTLMWRNFGLPVSPAGLPSPSAGEKLVIDVSVTQPPGQVAPWFSAPAGFSVPSPALYLAPVELTDAELLAQSITLPLLEHVLMLARLRHPMVRGWQPLLDGLYLWQLWDLDLPLSVWQQEVVQWLYVDVPAASPGHPVLLPDRYPELCAAHKLWMPSPLQIHIPFVCDEQERKNESFPSWGPREPLTHLDQLAVPVHPDVYVESSSRTQVRHSGQTVALATLIEYVVATYGRERLPVLVAGLGQYDSWETLLPAAFGVSATEFEAGWQAYLAEHYAVSLP